MLGRYDKNRFRSQEGKAKLVEAAERMIAWQAENCKDSIAGSVIDVHEDHYESKVLFKSHELAMGMAE